MSLWACKPTPCGWREVGPELFHCGQRTLVALLSGSARSLSCQQQLCGFWHGVPAVDLFSGRPVGQRLPGAPVGLEGRGIIVTQNMLVRAHWGGQQPPCGGTAQLDQLTCSHVMSGKLRHRETVTYPGSHGLWAV